jgi:hypothetical protein
MDFAYDSTATLQTPDQTQDTEAFFSSFAVEAFLGLTADECSRRRPEMADQLTGKAFIMALVSVTSNSGQANVHINELILKLE